MSAPPLRAGAMVALFAAAGILGTCGGEQGAGASPSPTVTLRIPARPADAVGGEAFMQRLAATPAAERQAAILAEIRRGNVPPFLRELVPVQLSWTSMAGRRVVATVRVMPDYLAIGSDRDFVRVPLDLYTASSIARDFGLRLPTRKIVNAVYQQAQVRLAPIPMTPGPRMGSPEYALWHNRMIERARAGRPLGVLTAGHKKDIVMTNRLARWPGRVAIYGWHRRNGQPIQPLSTVHGAGYADYSHGVRFVDATVIVDGRSLQYDDVLADPALAPVLTHEGLIAGSRSLLVTSRARTPR